MNRVVATAEEAEAALEYFNGFHDGFIKQLTLTSYDYFKTRGVQVCSGRLDLELEVAHYNYHSGQPPANQVVHARFTHVRHLHADMPGNPAEWSLANTHFEPGTRPTVGSEESCFYARFLQNRLDEGKWVLYEALGFSFREAEFRESPAT
jgi:sugar phosphate isomerase/epimerase